MEGRIDKLIESFERYLLAYDEDPPFKKPGQLDHHVSTIRLRSKAGSASAALRDDAFVESLWNTLAAWGMASRGSSLVPKGQFRDVIRRSEAGIAGLDGLLLDDSEFDVVEVANRAWVVIQSLDIVRSDAKLVAGTKALHHLLPDLIVPMDRAYTRVFLGWHTPEFQYGQGRIFSHAFERFIRIARATNPARFVGAGWRTSRTKVLDNAVIGFCRVESLPVVS